MLSCAVVVNIGIIGITRSFGLYGFRFKTSSKNLDAAALTSAGIAGGAGGAGDAGDAGADDNVQAAELSLGVRVTERLHGRHDGRHPARAARVS